MNSTLNRTAPVLLMLTMFVGGGLLAVAQTAPPKKRATPASSAPSAAATPAPASGLSIAEVIKMVEAKVPEHIIAAKVKRNAAPFDLTPEQLIALKKASASDALIEVLMDPSKPYSAPAAPVTTAPAPAEPKPAPAAPTPPEVQKPALDIGVYLRKDGEWTEVPPEIVNWKTGGTLKSLSTAGIVKKDLNGNIDGPSSRTSVKTPLEILIVTAEGVAAAEYQFLRLRVNKDYREFRSVTGGIMNQRSGAMRDLIPFESKKLTSRNFVLTVPASVGAGEYGFLPPGAAGTSTTNAVSSQYGKMYTFHVVE
jgi:hypothetical protein